MKKCFQPDGAVKLAGGEWRLSFNKVSHSTEMPENTGTIHDAQCHRHFSIFARQKYNTTTTTTTTNNGE